MKSTWWGLIILVVAVSLSACGGGGGSGIPGTTIPDNPVSGSNTPDSYYITINSVSITTPTTIPLDGTITAEWNVSYSSLGGGGYGPDLYLSKDTSLDTKTDHRMNITHTSCFLPPYPTVCQRTYGWGWGAESLFPDSFVGTWYIIAQASVYDSNLDMITDTYVLPQQLTITN